MMRDNKNCTSVILEKKKLLESQGREYHEPSHGVLVYGAKNIRNSLNLNCKVMDRSGNAITCDSLSYFVAMLNMKNYYSILSSRERISEQEILMKGLFDSSRVAYHSKWYYLISIEKVGNQLYELAKYLKKECEFSLLLQSEVHQMAITVQHEIEGYFIIKFYDPNITNSHMLALCQNLISIKNILIENFITLEAKSRYFPKFKEAVIFSRETVPEKSIQLLKAQAVNLEADIYYSLFFGWTDRVSLLIKDILNANFDSAKKVKLLLAKRYDNVLGFYMALQNGHVAAVTVYLNAIISSTLSNEEKFELIDARRDNGTCGFFMALYNGLTETVIAYATAVIESSLNIDQKIKLIVVRCDDGTSGYSLATSRGHANTKNACIKLIIGSNKLLIDEKLQLLMNILDPNCFYNLIEKLNNMSLGKSQTPSEQIDKKTRLSESSRILTFSIPKKGEVSLIKQSNELSEHNPCF